MIIYVRYVLFCDQNWLYSSFPDVPDVHVPKISVVSKISEALDFGAPEIPICRASKPPHRRALRCCARCRHGPVAAIAPGVAGGGAGDQEPGVRCEWSLAWLEFSILKLTLGVFFLGILVFFFKYYFGDVVYKNKLIFKCFPATVRFFFGSQPIGSWQPLLPSLPPPGFLQALLTWLTLPGTISIISHSFTTSSSLHLLS